MEHCFQTNNLAAHREYLPDDCFKSIIHLTQERLKTDHNEASYDINLENYMLHEAGRVFLILISIKKPELIRLFYQYRFTDSYLPIALIATTSEDGWGGVITIESLSRSSADDMDRKALSVFDSEGWDDSVDTFEFIEHQWRFLAPVFPINKFRYEELDYRMILPIHLVGRPVSLISSCSLKVTIHPAHLLQSDMLATNHLNTPFDIEVATISHPHIIRAVLAIQQGPSTYLITTHPIKGSLQELMRNSQVLVERSTESVWVFEQLLGLSSAVFALHKNGVRHYGNITPENLLLVEDGENRGKVTISDLKLASSIDRQITSKIFHLTEIPTLRNTRYEAPESLHLQEKSALNDVWTFGCIFLEFLIWFLWGPTTLRRFERELGQDDTKFWILNSETRRVERHGAIDWAMQWLREHDSRIQECQVLSDFLDLIDKRLLVVEVDSQAQGCRA
jgi:hypothetical protein